MDNAIYQQLQELRSRPDCPNLFDVKATFELAIRLGMTELCDFIFMDTAGYCTTILQGSSLNDEQLAQIQTQLPVGAEIVRWYTACEGDLRVIAKLPDEPHDVRYTVSYLIDGSPLITRMD